MGHLVHRFGGEAPIRDKPFAQSLELDALYAAAKTSTPAQSTIAFRQPMPPLVGDAPTLERFRGLGQAQPCRFTLGRHGNGFRSASNSSVVGDAMRRRLRHVRLPQRPAWRRGTIERPRRTRRRRVTGARRPTIAKPRSPYACSATCRRWDGVGRWSMLAVPADIQWVASFLPARIARGVTTRRNIGREAFGCGNTRVAPRGVSIYRVTRQATLRKPTRSRCSARFVMAKAITLCIESAGIGSLRALRATIYMIRAVPIER